MSNLTDADTTSRGDTMQVNTGEFRAIRAELAELTEQVQQLRARTVYTDALLDALLAPAQTGATRHRRRHLQPVGDDAS
jgi:hypothetical protein